MDLHYVEINDVLFVDKKHHDVRIKSGNRKSKQLFTDTVDLHNAEINDVIFVDKQCHNDRI